LNKQAFKQIKAEAANKLNQQQVSSLQQRHSSSPPSNSSVRAAVLYAAVAEGAIENSHSKAMNKTSKLATDQTKL
jgi:hypothetical protein